ncbi:MAG: acyl-protein synthetase [Myxococcaceae bacterium]
MSALLDAPPYGPRDEAALLREAVELTRKHLAGCRDYAAIWPDFSGAESLEGLPYLHVGLFKRIAFRTEGVKHQRVLLSSATTSGTSSQVALDEVSAQLQAKSSLAILKDFVGVAKRPLVVIDDAASLRQRGQVSARVAAALSLLPLATTTTFLLKGEEPQWSLVEDAVRAEPAFFVYGFTWALWKRWAQGGIPSSLKELLTHKQIHFVHSGGWKKLEAEAVSREALDGALLSGAAAGSRVIDFYGLVEQNGVIFPLCEAGARHVPRWATVIVRDPWTMKPAEPGQQGLLQFINVLAHGAPYHSVLTEDLGSLLEGPCPCGRSGPRFTLHGRVPKAELRGCANV